MEDIPTKSPGSQYLSSEFNSTNSEEKNLIKDTGIPLSAGDLHQFSKSVSNYVASGDFYVDSGIADAYDLDPLGLKQAPTQFSDGLRVRFLATNTNTGASTAQLATLGTKDIKKYGGGIDLEPGDILDGRLIELVYISSLDVWEIVSIGSAVIQESIALFPPFSGMTMSNNIAAPLTDIDVSPGTFKNRDTFDAFTSLGTISKELNNVWAEGTGNGGRASAVAYAIDTWYHVFMLGKQDGTVDFGFDTDIDATNLLADAAVIAAGYTFFRRRGSVLTDGAMNIIPFLNFGDTFIWTAPFTQPLTLTLVYAPYIVTCPIDVFTDASIAFGESPGVSSGSSEVRIRSSFMTSASGMGDITVVFGATSPHTSIGGTGFTQIIVDQSSSIEMLTLVPANSHDLIVSKYRELQL